MVEDDSVASVEVELAGAGSEWVFDAAVARDEVVPDGDYWG